MNRDPVPDFLLKAAIAILFLFSLEGCISESVTSSAASSGSSASSSESSSSPSKSSSKNKSGSGEKGNYQKDVANLASSVSVSQIPPSDFANALTRLAAQDKISHWESEKTTFLALGEGLKQAGVAYSSIESLACLEDVLASRKDALSLIQEGYKDAGN